MSDSATRDSINAALKIAAANYEPRRRSKQKQLLPLKEGIAALREGGASFRLIAELLTQQGVPISDFTVRAFCRAEIEGVHRAVKRTDTRRNDRNQRGFAHVRVTREQGTESTFAGNGTGRNAV